MILPSSSCLLQLVLLALHLTTMLLLQLVHVGLQLQLAALEVLHLAGEVVQLLLLLPQTPLKVRLLLLEPRHLLIVGPAGLELGDLPGQAGDLVLLVLNIQFHRLVDGGRGGVVERLLREVLVPPRQLLQVMLEAFLSEVTRFISFHQALFPEVTLLDILHAFLPQERLLCLQLNYAFLLDHFSAVSLFHTLSSQCSFTVNLLHTLLPSQHLLHTFLPSELLIKLLRTFLSSEHVLHLPHTVLSSSHLL